MPRSIASPLLSGTFVLLTACGGSSSGGAPTPNLQVGSVNALLITGAVLDATLGLARAIDDGNGVLTARAAGAQAAAKIDVSGLLTRRLRDLWSPRTLPVLVNGSQTGPGGGTATYLWDDRDANERLSTGDTFEMLFEQFVDDTGARLDGWIGIDQVQVMGRPAEHSTWSVDARMALRNLAVTTAGGTTNLAGSLQCGIDRRPTVTYQRLAVIEPLTSDVSMLLPGTVVEHAEYDAEYTFRTASTGTLSGAGLGGTVAYETTTALGGFTFEPNPSRGVIEVRGKGAGAIVITIVDASTVQIEVDLDGDGEADDTQTIEWSAL